MLNHYKDFSIKHPYGHVIFILSITSLLGILIEYLINRDFIGSGIYATIFFGIIEIFRVRRKNKNN